MSRNRDVRLEAGGWRPEEDARTDASSLTVTSHQRPTTSQAPAAIGRVISSSSPQPAPSRLAFTLIELLITISVIGIMASMILFALYRAQETAKAHKTRALIANLDQVIKDKWQTYQYRRVPVNLSADTYEDTGATAGAYDSGDTLRSDWNGDGTYTQNADGTPRAPTPVEAAKIRLDSIHELMRWELPDRYSDIVDVTPGTYLTENANQPSILTSYASAGQCIFPLPSPKFPPPISQPELIRPSLGATYDRRIYAGITGTPPPNKTQPNIDNQGSEMLYLIVMQSLAGDEDSRAVFKPDNIGDTDNDGMPEFIDGWGRPIKFLRWAPGAISDLQIVARVVVANSPAPGATTTVTSGSPGLSATNGAYVGGAMGIIDPSPPGIPNLTPKPIIGNRMARITGYSYDPTTRIGTFTCAGQIGGQAFNLGPPPNMNDTVVIMAPDPFDPTDVQRMPLSEPSWNYYTTNHYVPSFATYPLIYSAGPDGKYGIMADIHQKGSVPPYSFVANKDLPFVEFSSIAGVPDPKFLLLGSPCEVEPGYPAASLDNIHNHLQGLR
jgi:prepilin-type N-terminal cleavage/methylation domain-containing protein